MADARDNAPEHQQVMDKDQQTSFTVERHHGGVALIMDTYGRSERIWFRPQAAKKLAAMLIAKSEESQP